MKLIRTLALSGILAIGAAGLVSMAPPAALGQAPKAAPPAKAAPAKPAEAAGKVVITKDKSGKFRFQIRDADDKTLAMSTVGYESEDAAKKMLETVKALLNSKTPELEK